MKKTITLLAVSALLVKTQKVQAQQNLGMTFGNHNASYAYSLNPSQTYMDKNRFYVNLWGAGIGFNNNFLTYKAPISLWRWGSEGGNISANSVFDDNGGWLRLNPNTNHWRLYYFDETYGPSAHFRLDNKQALGFGIKGVSALSINGVNRNFGNLISALADTARAFAGPNSALLGKEYGVPRFSANTAKWQEWYASYAWVTRDRGPHFVKWGVTGKMLLGFGAAHIGSNSGSYTFTGPRQMQFDNLQATYFYSGDNSAANTLTNPFGMKFDFLQGFGLGMDVGFTYENRPAANRQTYRDWLSCATERDNRYRWRIGASLTDFGFIGYSGSSYRIDTLSAPRNWNVKPGIIDKTGMDNESRFTNVGQQFFDSMGAQKDKSFPMFTPAALNVQYDLRTAGNFHFGVSWTQSLKGTYSLGVRRPSSLSIIPRWEFEHFELGLPVTLGRDYTALNMGVYGRLGPFTLGTDQLGGLLRYAARGNYNGANIYFGVRIKLVACGWDYYHRHDKFDTMRKTEDPKQTENFWKRDTVTVVKYDTIKITKRDTVVKYKNTEISTDLKVREEKMRKAEEELKKREAIVIAKEAELKKGEVITMSRTSPCDKQLKQKDSLIQVEQTKNAKLTARVTKLQTDYDLLVRADDANRKRIAQLEADLKNCKSTTGTVTSVTVKDCQDTINKLQSRIAAEKAKVTNLEKELTTCKASITPGDNKACQDRIKVLEAQIAAEKAKTTTLEKDLASCRLSAGSGKECLDKVKQLEAEIAAEKAKNTVCSTDLAKTKALLDAEVKKTSQLTLDLDNCRKASDSDKKRIAELEALLKNPGDDCAAYKLRVAELEKQLGDLKKNYDAEVALNKDLQEKLKNCSGSSEELNKTKADLEASKKRVAELEAQISDCSKQKNQLNADLTAAKNKITELEAKIKECEGKGNDCSDCEDKLSQAKISLEQKNSAYDALMEEYKQCGKDVQALKTKLSECEGKLKDCGGSSSNENALKAEIDKLKRTISELNAEVAAGQKSLSELQKSYDGLEAQNASLSKQITEKEATITSLKSQLAGLQQQLKECQEAGNK